MTWRPILASIALAGLVAAQLPGIPIAASAPLTEGIASDAVASRVLPPAAGRSEPVLARTAGRPPGHEPRFANDTIIVGFHAGTPTERIDQLLVAEGGQTLRQYVSGARLVRLPSGSVERAVTVLARLPEVRYAELDYVVELQREPNDPSLDQLWGLINGGQVVDGVAGTPDADIDAELAWDITTGSSSIVVGIIDTGVDQDHPDLVANLWSNPGGVGGCRAGTHGYNAYAPPCSPEDDHNHGTHVAGTIGAVGNDGQGVVGVNWTTSVMALKAFNAQGSATTSTILATMDFALQARDAGVPVRVLNASWGGYDFSQAILDAIRALGDRDVLFVAAAGNYGFPNDAFPLYPCAYDTPTLVCVAASDQADTLAYFSNYGAVTVDLAAPGVNVLSTIRNGLYAYFDGTSMATPHVTGAAALLLSRKPVPVATLRQALLDTVDIVPSLSGAVASGGRLNVATALTAVGPLPRAPVLSGTAESGVVHLSWTEPAPGDAPLEAYRLYRGEGAADTALLAQLPATVRSYDDTAVVNGTSYRYEVSAVNALGEGPRSQAMTLTPTPAPVWADDFNDNALDATFWNAEVIGSGPVVSETNQRLELFFPANSAESGQGVFRAAYLSRCTLRGDFDLQVDYALLTWPGGNGVRLGLWAGWSMQRTSFGTSDFPGQPREAYLVDTGGAAQNILGTSDTSGRLRLTRVGSTITGYRSSADGWLVHYSATGSTADTGLLLGAWSHDAVFRDRKVRAAFDTFVLSSGQLVCP